MAITQALGWWSLLYVGAGGSPAFNSRVTVRAAQLWWYNTHTATWTNGFGPSNIFDGGYYSADLSAVQLSKISFSTETDGTRSYDARTNLAARCSTPFPRVPIDSAYFGGVVSLAQARLVLIDSSGHDDRDRANFVFGVGVDAFVSQHDAGTSLLTPLAWGALKKVTTAWRSFAATTCSAAFLEAHPPPINLTGVNP